MKTQSAQCASLIRKELKKAFPSIKFQVRSDNYAGGDSVNIRYTDGVPTEKIYEIVNKFQYGHFDGMIDLYEYDNKIEGLAQAKYIMVNREISPEVKEQVKNQIMTDYGMTEWNEEECFKLFRSWSDQVIYKHSSQLTFA